MSGFTTIAKAFRGGLKPKAARAYIAPLDIHHNDEQFTQDDDQTRVFQYFPESISDTKGVNYSTKVIPGLSHPLYQWTSGGPREVSFTALFTRDRALSSSEWGAAVLGGKTAQTQSSVADIREATAGLAGLVRTLTGSELAKGEDARNVDIPSAIMWLRSFMDPEYTTDGVRSAAVPTRPFPPRKMILGMPGVRLNWGVPTLPASEIYCIMMSCDVSYQSFFADGTPRIAAVDLVFAEIIQIAGTISPHDAADKRSVAMAGYTQTNKNLRNG